MKCGYINCDILKHEGKFITFFVVVESDAAFRGYWIGSFL